MIIALLEAMAIKMLQSSFHLYDIVIRDWVKEMW